MFAAAEQAVRLNLDTDDVAGSDSVRGDGAVGEPEVHDDIAVHGTEISTHDEDVEPGKAVRNPYAPTASELSKHRVDYSPYRDWCPEHLEATGREAPHRYQDKTSWVPVISCDYLFVSACGVLHPG